MVCVSDVLAALDTLTGGRVVKAPACYAGNNRFVVTKTSGVPGKSITELPGLVWGRPDMPVKKLAVLMTLTESAIELAGATGVDCIVAHHPIAEAANMGGVLARDYLDLYGIAVFELHEAFHGLHPGIAWLHGSKALRSEISYGGVLGKIVWFGEALPELNTLGDFIKRIDEFMGFKEEEIFLKNEMDLRGYTGIQETTVAARAKIFVGDINSKLGKTITFFPHTGFNADDMEKTYREYQADTFVSCISRPLDDNKMVDKARSLGVNLVAGNSHAMEIFENGIPLARAIKNLLPEIEVRIFRERMTSVPLDVFGTPTLQEYGRKIAREYLPKPKNSAQ
ncbi:hypothetical protein AGMMS49546_35800 [Spirochaetia bacterium]|nr:hypothetical protein AGMMS49546_35800 [Spirochaetia bacterium]